MNLKKSHTRRRWPAHIEQQRGDRPKFFRRHCPGNMTSGGPVPCVLTTTTILMTHPCTYCTYSGQTTHPFSGSGNVLVVGDGVFWAHEPTQQVLVRCHWRARKAVRVTFSNERLSAADHSVVRWAIIAPADSIGALTRRSLGAFPCPRYHCFLLRRWTGLNFGTIHRNHAQRRGRQQKKSAAALLCVGGTILHTVALYKMQEVDVASVQGHTVQQQIIMGWTVDSQ